MTNKLRIGVLMGGKSIEREVSFNSGRTICDHLDTQRYAIVPLFQTADGKLYILPQHFLHRGKIADFIHRLDQEAQAISLSDLKRHVDFIYLAVHGRYGEDGTLQGVLEILQIPYLGSKIFGSALGMDKSMQKSFLQSQGINVPHGIVLTPHDLEQNSIDAILEQLSSHDLVFPLIVKPAHEGSSLGISAVHTADELSAALIKASIVDDRRKQHVIVEEKLNGLEFVCVSLERISNNNGTITRSWYSLPLTEVIIEDHSTIFDYEQKYMPGKALKVTPARCSNEDADKITATCEQAASLLGFSTISRIDGFLTNDGTVVIIDPNSLTGMSPSTFLFNQAAEYGMSHTDLINVLIENELKSYNLIDDTSWLPAHKGEAMSTTKEKIRVGVLLGGDSNEREVSLESGRNVCYKLSPHKYEVIPLFVNDSMELFTLSQTLLIKNTTRAIAQLVSPELRVEWSDLPNICDFVFIALHGGRGENGAVQGMLEMLDMPYNGPGVLTSALCMDKFKTNNFLRAQGFAVPKNTLLLKALWSSQSEKQAFLEAYLKAHDLALPVIVKPHDDGCSVMVSKATTMIALIDVLDKLFATAKQAALLEELIIGTELTVGVIGNNDITALPPSMAIAHNGVLSVEEKFLPGAGENQTPAPLAENIISLVQKTVARAFKACAGHGYSRIDCFYQDALQSPTGNERVVILECNTLPALTPATCLFHQAAEVGMHPMDLIDKIIELGLAYHHSTHAIGVKREKQIVSEISTTMHAVENEALNNEPDVIPAQIPHSLHSDESSNISKMASAQDELVFMKLF